MSWQAGGARRKRAGLAAAATRGERRRAAILAAAGAIFLDRGFERATLGAIIARSGGSRATIYAEFGGKEGLFAAIIDELCGNLVGRLAETEVADAPLEETLRAFGRAFMEVLMSPVGLALYRTVIAESVRFPRLGEAVYRAGPLAGSARLAAYFSTR